MNKNEEKLADVKEKLKKFEELANSLQAASPTTLSVLVSMNASLSIHSSLTLLQRPIVEKLRTEHRRLEYKIKEDSKELSKNWEDVLNAFLRAICEHVDKEVEAGTEFLQQETRVLFKLLSKKCAVSVQSVDSSSEMLYPLEYPDETPGDPSVRTICCRCKQVKSNTENTCCYFNCEKTIARLQEQIDKQSEKIDFLLRREGPVSENLSIQSSLIIRIPIDGKYSWAGSTTLFAVNLYLPSFKILFHDSMCIKSSPVRCLSIQFTFYFRN